MMIRYRHHLWWNILPWLLLWLLRLINIISPTKHGIVVVISSNVISWVIVVIIIIVTHIVHGYLVRFKIILCKTGVCESLRPCVLIHVVYL